MSGFAFIGMIVVLAVVAAALVYGGIFFAAKAKQIQETVLARAALEEIERDFDRIRIDYNIIIGELMAYERIRDFINALAPDEKALFTKFPVTRERRVALSKYLERMREIHALKNREMRKIIGVISDPDALPTEAMSDELMIAIRNISEFEKQFINHMTQENKDVPSRRAFS